MRHEYKPFITIEGAFNKEEVDTILALPYKLEVGRISASKKGGKVAKKNRDNKAARIPLTSETQGLFNKVLFLLKSINSNHLYFDWDEWIEPLQISKYTTKNSTYPWHTDLGVGGAIHRKLSCSVILNEGYEGGELQFFVDTEPISVPQKVGSIVVFPAYTLHRVTPVTKGEKLSLQAFGHGPRWR